MSTDSDTRDSIFDRWGKLVFQLLLLICCVVLVAIWWHDHTLNKRKDPFTTDISLTYQRQAILSESGSSKEYRLKADVSSLVNAEQIDEGIYKNEASINKVYWPDGGYTTFGTTSEDLPANPCVVDHYNISNPVKCQASNGDRKMYNVELLAPTD